MLVSFLGCKKSLQETGYSLSRGKLVLEMSVQGTKKTLTTVAVEAVVNRWRQPVEFLPRSYL